MNIEFHIEYVDTASGLAARMGQVCGLEVTKGFSTIIKLRSLNAWRGTFTRQ